MEAKKRRKLGGKGGIFVILAAVVFIFCTAAFGQPWDGNGVEGDPYQIWTAEDMQAIGADANYWDAHFELMADINLGAYTGTGFNIVGENYYDANLGWIENPFTGVFDGNGYTILNFTYDSNGMDTVGLFGYIEGKSAEVKDLGLLDPNVRGVGGRGTMVGALVGRLGSGTVAGCYGERVNVGGDRSVGALVGINIAGEITNCHSSGIVGGGSNVGGLVGFNSGAGYILECYSTAAVSGTSNNVGGLVGKNLNGRISNSCAKEGSILGSGSVGGLVGENSWGVILVCYASGYVSGTTNVGGLVGNNDWGDIVSCYSVGVVSGTDSVGGLVGGGGGMVCNSFWDINTSEQVSSRGGTGKTTTELQDSDTYFGWGCGASWTIDAGVDYPHLEWEGMAGDIISNPSPAYGGGSGTENDPYLIYTGDQLNSIGLIYCDWDRHFKLMADIDLSAYVGTSFNIIGLGINNAFRGTFDGNGKRIINYTYDATEARYIGLFGRVVGEEAEIRNLGLVDPNVSVGINREDRIGCLVGYLEKGTVRDCYVEDGRVLGDRYVGGLVGSNGYLGGSGGVVRSCYAACSVEGNKDVGGLIGLNLGTVGKCDANSVVLGHKFVGGLVGYNNDGGNIWDCRASGNVEGTSSEIGGLVGYNRSGVILKSWSSASVSGASEVGGLVGCNYDTVTACLSTGDVLGDAEVGGLAGRNWEGVIFDSYAAGNVGGAARVGGLVGYNYYEGIIRRCYSIGWVSGLTEVGGLVGDNAWYGYAVGGSFWDVNSSGMDASAGGAGRTTVEMQMGSTFTSAGWDFNTPIWTIDEGVDYPRLCWETNCMAANTEPVACVVGGDRVVEADSNCEGRVVLDGSCSSDGDSTEGTNDDINDFDWYEVVDACEPNSDIYLGSGEVIECNLGLGEHLIMLEVTDKAGAFDSNEVVITVVDVMPPEFSLVVEPNVLWPPNGKMVEVRPEWEVSDNCDEEVEVSLVDITMSAAGDINDYAVIGDDGSIYLRARKSKGGNGRIYTLTYEAVDDSGNVTQKDVTVTVPHRKGPRRLGSGLVRWLGRQVYRRGVQRRGAIK